MIRQTHVCFTKLKEFSLFILTLLHRRTLRVCHMVSFFLESEFLKQEQRQKSDSEREMFSLFGLLFFSFLSTYVYHLLIARKIS